MYTGALVEFEEMWNSLKICFGENSEPVKYLENTWICHKETFDFVLGQPIYPSWKSRHVTSRVEGAHITLKYFLDNSCGDLLVEKEKITLKQAAVSNQRKNIN